MSYQLTHSRVHGVQIVWHIHVCTCARLHEYDVCTVIYNCHRLTTMSSHTCTGQAHRFIFPVLLVLTGRTALRRTRPATKNMHNGLWSATDDGRLCVWGVWGSKGKLIKGMFTQASGRLASPVFQTGTRSMRRTGYEEQGP